MKMKSQKIISFFFLFACVIVFGCKSEKKPEGMPPIYSTEITILSEGKELADVGVVLLPVDKTQQWTAGGTTDSSGKATMNTYSKFPGAPEGKFKVCVSKSLDEPAPNTDPDSPSVGYISYNLVDTKYGDPETTDFEIEIFKGQKNAATFDVGPVIKELVR